MLIIRDDKVNKNYHMVSLILSGNRVKIYLNRGNLVINGFNRIG